MCIHQWLGNSSHPNDTVSISGENAGYVYACPQQLCDQHGFFDGCRLQRVYCGRKYNNSGNTSDTGKDGADFYRREEVKESDFYEKRKFG